MDIFLWGPRGAGKTWLLNALIHQINLMEDELRNNESLFDIWVEDIMNQRVSCTELEQKATTDIDYVTYILRRRYNSEETNRNHELKRSACTHDHQISMLDGPGDVVTGEILNYALSEENKAKVLSAQTRLKTAKYLIVTINGGSPKESESKEEIQRQIGNKFAENLQRLIHLSRAGYQKVYLCFTKIDQYQGTGAKIESMLPLLFGRYSVRIESLLRDLLQIHQGTIPAYFVSAPGYYYNRQGILVPNYENEKLADEMEWKPYGVGNLFFDIFDNGEKEAIKNLELDQPIPNLWILPKKLQKFINNELKEAHKRDIINAFVSYRDMCTPKELGIISK
jgi:GTPase SAR1 family protein